MTGVALEPGARVTVSIVSHGHGAWLPALVADLARCLPGALEVILTLNVAESLPDGVTDTALPLHVLRNTRPCGFGANHNAAFRIARSERFCVLNPDVRIHDDPFPALLAALADTRGGIVAPRVRAPDGSVENSARPYPTLSHLIARLAGRSTPFQAGDMTAEVDWVAGMFMLIDSAAFDRLGGFDESYFLYYEDVDLCARARLAGGQNLLVPSAEIVHTARRTSHHSPRYAWWHVRSMLRFLCSSTYAALRERKWLGP